MQGSNKALESFLVESAENLQQLEQDLVILERQPEDSERLASAFRAMHTIKGTCGFFGFPHLETLTHAMEDVLVALRDGTQRLDFRITSVLLEGIDAVRELLALIQHQGNDGDQPRTTLVERLHGLMGNGEPTPANAESNMDNGTDESVTSKTSYAEEAGSQESSIRVDIALLDKLMNVVGELVLARNQLLQHASHQEDAQLLNLSQRLNLVTSELQEGLMKTRMQPISNAWAAYPRLIRDLEQQTGKKILLEQSGGDTELDRSLLQAIRDPLVHLLRNAVDHGVESPEQRRAAGKAEAGRLKLRAWHESGNVIIELTDDGAGINRDAILTRAIQRNILRQDQADQLSDKDVLGLMFLPGFSTAEKVSNISGRGVGLDVVRTNVERIGGSIDIHSEPGVGTALQIKIPLTLAIIPALIVGCRHERFAVPQINLLEVVQIPADETIGQISEVHGSLVYRLRGKLLPLVDLRQTLNMGQRTLGKEDLFVLVLQAEMQVFGLIVDSVRDTEEIVVKPLGKLLRDIHCFAGATIMGDGKVALIIDVRATAEYANLVDNEKKNRLVSSNADTAESDHQALESLLIIQPTGKRSRAAILLSQVARLEEFPASSIEYSAGREAVQYRNRILPLVRLDTILGLQADRHDHDCIQVVVQSSQRGDIGLIVGEIIDIIDDDISGLQSSDSQQGILGSVIIQGHVTDIIDAKSILDRFSGVLHNPNATGITTEAMAGGSHD